MTMNTSHLPDLTRAVTSPTSFSRRRLLAGLLGAPVVVALPALLAACGDDTVEPAGSDTTDGSSTPTTAPADSGSIGYPTDPTTAVVRITYEGGFVPIEYAFVNTPTLVVSGDGRAFVPGAVTAIFPGPLLQPMAVRTVTPVGIERLLARAQELGLLAPAPSYEVDVNVADAPDTVVRIATTDGTWEHRAYALGMETDSSGAPSATTPARQALLRFVLAATDLPATVGAAELGTESIHSPNEYRLRAIAVDESTATGMDPAPVVVEWPASTGLDLATATDCARLSASAAGSVFADATQLTWFRQGDAVYQLAVAGVLPGDPAC
jgi:hypothetical protein